MVFPNFESQWKKQGIKNLDGKICDSKSEGFQSDCFSEKSRLFGKTLSQPEKFKVEKTALNTEFSDFGAFQNNGNVYFASARNTSGKTYGWNKQPTLDLYVANQNFSNIKPIDGEVNTKFNEGSITISADGKRCISHAQIF